MSVRELIVLGTSSQVPTRARNHNACFLRWDDLGFLIDPGEGTQRQMTIAGLPASAITHVLITHFHGDHCLGLASMAQRISLDRVAHAVEVLFPASGLVYYERLVSASIYHAAGWLAPRPLDVRGADLDLGPLRLVARPLDHPVDTLGYRLEEPDTLRFVPEALAALGLSGPAVGELERKGSIEHAGRVVTLADVTRPRPGSSFAFVMDTRACAGAAELACGADLLVAEATYLEADRALAREHFHLTAAGAARLAAAAGARALVLTHFSQRYDDIEAFRAEAAAVFPRTVAARDFDRFAVPRRSGPGG